MGPLRQSQSHLDVVEKMVWIKRKFADLQFQSNQEPQYFDLLKPSLKNVFKAQDCSPYHNVTESLNPNQAQNLPSKAAFVCIYSQDSILGWALFFSIVSVKPQVRLLC